MSASTALRCAVSSARFTQVLGFVRARLGWVGLGWVGLGWVGLGWVI